MTTLILSGGREKIRNAQLRVRELIAARDHILGELADALIDLCEELGDCGRTRDCAVAIKAADLDATAERTMRLSAIAPIGWGDIERSEADGPIGTAPRGKPYQVQRPPLRIDGRMYFVLSAGGVEGARTATLLRAVRDNDFDPLDHISDKHVVVAHGADRYLVFTGSHRLRVIEDVCAPAAEPAAAAKPKPAAKAKRKAAAKPKKKTADLTPAKRKAAAKPKKKTAPLTPTKFGTVRGTPAQAAAVTPAAGANGKTPAAAPPYALAFARPSAPEFQSALRAAPRAALVEVLASIKDLPGKKKAIEKIEARIRKLDRGAAPPPSAPKDKAAPALPGLFDDSGGDRDDALRELAEARADAFRGVDVAGWRDAPVHELDFEGHDLDECEILGLETVGDVQDWLLAQPDPNRGWIDLLGEWKDRLERNAAAGAKHRAKKRDAEKSAAAAAAAESGARHV